MILRSLVGALLAVAVLGAVAVALPESVTRKATLSAPPYGDLPKPQFIAAIEPNASTATLSDATSRSLLKLAAKPGPAAPAVVQPAAVRSESAAASVDMASLVTASTPVVQPAVFVPFAAKPQPAPRAEPAPPAPAQTAALEEPQAPPRPSSHAGEAVNINKASVDALDHLGGAGRIGAAIARRRPYHSIDDLVTRRVLRRAAFARIRPLITVD